jgi:hypothetical protein
MDDGYLKFEGAHLHKAKRSLVQHLLGSTLTREAQR